MVSEVGGNAGKYSAQGSKKDFNSGSRTQNDAKKFNPRSSRGGFDKRSKQRGCYGSGPKEEVRLFFVFFRFHNTY